MRYPGGKGQAGIYQRIISMMPPHDVYIESHAGGANILERKKPARESWAVDLDNTVIAALAARASVPNLSAITGDAAAFLRNFDYSGRRVLIYSDPPYVMATRKSGPRYLHEYTDEQHHELLAVLRQVPALVMISGYRCPMYDAALSRWHRLDYPAWTRGGSFAIESLWFNFDPPAWPHDCRYLGEGYRDRWRMTKKRRRWRSMLLRMPAYERVAMLSLLLELAASDSALAAGEASIAGNGAAGSRSVGFGAAAGAPALALVDVVDPSAGPGAEISPGILAPSVALRSSAPCPALLERRPGARLGHPGGRL